MKQSLMIHATGKINDSQISTITGQICDHHCQILKSRLTSFSDHWALIAQVAGQWNNLSKLENSLIRIAEKQGIQVHSQRCNDLIAEGTLLPYTVECIAPESAELLHEICSFFDNLDIMITDIYTQTNDRNYTHTPITTLVIKIYIPTEIQLTELREQFMLLCDDINIDAILEPEKR